MLTFSTLCVVLLGIYCKASQLAGPYDIVIHRVYPCAGVPLTEGSLRFSKEFTPYNKTTILYSSNVTLPHGFHDGMRGVGDLSILTRGYWRKNFINFRFNKVCSEMNKVVPKLYKSFFEAAGTNYSGCPFKSGTYNVRNWTPDMSVPTGIFPYNTYKAEFSLFEMENRVSCMVTEFDVIPKV